MSATQAFLRAGGRLSALLAFFAVAAIAGTLIACIVTPGIALAGTTASKQISAFQNLPGDLEISPLDQKTRIYAKSKGKEVLLGSFFAQNRDTVTAAQVPDTVKKAAIAAEDVRFYQHGPIDPQGIARAVVDNARGSDISGASTISQQYVKNVCLANAERVVDSTGGAAAAALAERDQAHAAVEGAKTKAAAAKARRLLASRGTALAKANAAADRARADLESCRAKSVERKIREARYAIGLEKKYSKDQILLGYLNIAGFGGRTYGIEAASQYYYDKKAVDLSIGEAATLMSIVNNPEAFRLDRKENLAGAKGRRDYVLNTELRYGMITQEDHDKAIAEPITTKITPPSTGCDTAGSAGFFCDYVVKTILNSKEFGKDRATRLANLTTKGWRVYTTANLDLIRKAQPIVTRYVPMKSRQIDVGSAAVTVQPGTGRVLSMVQNKVYDASGAKYRKDRKYSAVNYSVNNTLGAGAGYQPGSTFKTFTLIGWLKSGHSIGQTVNANPRTIPASNFTGCDGPMGGDPWTFKNDSPSEKGNMTVAAGTAGSVNGVFASMAEEQNLCDLRKQAESMGAKNAAGGHLDLYPTMSIGVGSSIAPLDMAVAYATIADKGITCSAIGIDKVLDSDGKSVPVPKANCRRTVPENVAVATGYALHAVITSGTMYGDQTPDGKFLFGKTGTTDDAKHTWAIGSTDKATTAVWVGNADGSVNLRHIFGDGAYCRGAQYAVKRHCVWLGIQTVVNRIYGGSDGWPTPESQFLYGGRAITHQDAAPQAAPKKDKPKGDKGDGDDKGGTGGQDDGGGQDGGGQGDGGGQDGGGNGQ